MNGVKIIKALLHMRHENLMLRVELCKFRNQNPAHDEARLTEVKTLLKLFEEWTDG